MTLESMSACLTLTPFPGVALLSRHKLISPIAPLAHGQPDVTKRDILEVGVGGNPKVGGFSNLEYYRRGQSIGDCLVLVVPSGPFHMYER